MRAMAAAGMVLMMAVAARGAEAGTRAGVDLSGEGWVLTLDKEAKWKEETLYAPGTGVKEMEAHPPTASIGGWEGLLKQGMAVSVPGTVEGFVQKGEGPSGDYVGVSWWVRKVKVPSFREGQRVLLKVEAARQRTEVYAGGKLVGYDLVGNTPFDVDVTGSVKSGEETVLAFRVTDPGGNHDWRDGEAIVWGKYKVPISHGFGGITGKVGLEVVEPVWVSDVYVQNLPVATTVKAWVTLKNETASEQARDLVVGIKDKEGKEVARKEVKGVLAPPGERTLPVVLEVPGAALWSVESPALYTCGVEVFAPVVKGAVDRAEQRFGFRWFGPEGIGEEAVFRLNGKRVVLRTAISWGYWGGNGMVPSDAMAERQVRVAKEMGLNMLNFHRAIGQRNVLEKADELGLMYYEEPGGYVSGDGDALATALMREKVLRMVKRDRSHPSLVIYNLINEGWTGHGGEREASVAESRVRRMQEMHALDPSRTITHTSAWAKGADVEDRAKMQMRPFDETVYLNGWFDFHHAGGPEVWQQGLYKGPESYYLRNGNRKEIVYWGEEGAISTPPRLEKIKAEIEANGGKLGWDGQVYLEWYKTFDDFITRKGLRGAFPSVEALTVSMGNVSMYHQGRKIETIRLDDVTDGYAINGWEAEVVDDHSGVVDCFRYPKGDPGLIARYNVPVFVAVKARQEVVNAKGGEAVVDFHLVNEAGLKGKMTLRAALRGPEGKALWKKEEAVEAKGGEVYGQLLVAGVKVPVGQGVGGMYKIEAEVVDSLGKVVAKGMEEICAVEWASNTLAGTGAVWEGENKVRKFMKEKKGKEAAAFEPGMGRLDWLVVARGPEEAPLRAIPAGAWEGEVNAAYLGTDGKKVIGRREEKGIGLKVTDGKEVMPGVPVEGFGATWEGKVVPPVGGTYRFSMKTTGGAKLTVNGKLLFDKANDRKFQVNEGTVELEAGKAATVAAEFYQRRGDSSVELQWAVPEPKVDVERILARVKEEGTTLIVLDKADAWMERIAEKVGVTYKGKFEIGLTWLGGIHFVKEHPLFAGLPVNGAMDWPYQAVVREGRLRYALRLEGEELVAGGWHCYPMELGTAVGVIRHGKGKIVVSALDVANSLGEMGGPEEVGRKLLCNFIDYAGQSR